MLQAAAGALLTVNLGDGFETRVLRLSTGEMERLTGGWYVRYSPTGHTPTCDSALLDGRLCADGRSLRPGGDGADRIARGSLGICSRVFYLRYWTLILCVLRVSRTLLFYTGVRGTLGFGRYSPVWVDREGASREIDPGWLLEGQALFGNLFKGFLSPILESSSTRV